MASIRFLLSRLKRRRSRANVVIRGRNAVSPRRYRAIYGNTAVSCPSRTTRTKNGIGYKLLRKSMKARFRLMRRLRWRFAKTAVVYYTTRPLRQGSVKLDKRAAAFITSVYHGCATLHAFESHRRAKISSSPRLYRTVYRLPSASRIPSSCVSIF